MDTTRNQRCLNDYGGESTLLSLQSRRISVIETSVPMERLAESVKALFRLVNTLRLSNLISDTLRI